MLAAPMIRILIGGDFCPRGVNSLLAKQGDAQGLFNDLMPCFECADLAMVNLEGPLIRTESPIHKTGPALGVQPECVRVLVAAGIHVVGLANNHTMDHGAQGLFSTMETCEQHGITCVGAGLDVEMAGQMLVTPAGPLQVGIIAMSEHQFGIAGRQTPGVNPLDVMSFVRTVERSRDMVDFLVVLIHGGNERFPYPRPSLMQTSRFLVEQGADVVVCQHSHCVGCYEAYQGGHIVYGQGNLLFDAQDPDPEFYKGVLVCLDVPTSGAAQMELIPFRQSSGQPGVQRMNPAEAEQFLREVKGRSQQICDPDFVDEKWDEFCEKEQQYYLRRLGGPHRLVRGIDRLTGLLQHLLARRSIRNEYLNLIRCESHREVLLNILSRDPHA
jgi:poly-gamma-glutamate capsule biosynthesis protein CapA/YwtB (metallophosphatase superfamily)